MAEDPIVAVATGMVPSALAVIRVSGEGSVSLVAEAFSRPEALRAAEGHTLHHGSVLDSHDRPIDDVLVSVFRTPRSYTGEESAEISCHGSPAGVRRIVARMYEIGFRPAEPGEFTRRAFLNGKLDLTRAEAVNEIVNAQTAAAHAMAVDRLDGGVSDAVEEIRAAIVSALARVSIQLDYPEEETGEINTDAGALRAASRRARALAATFERGRLFQDGATVALAGPTNAGKSSLFNAMLRQDRSIVSDTHGTTRDYVEALLNLDGIPVRLFDTAGLRATEEAIEGEGIRRSRSIVESADLLLMVVDGSDAASVAAGCEELGQARGTADDVGPGAAASTAGRRPAMLVVNKSDVAAPGGARRDSMPRDQSGAATQFSRSVAVSATTGAGIEELAQAITSLLVERTGAAPHDRVARGVVAHRTEGVVIDSQRQRGLLVRCADALEQAIESVEAGMPADAVSVDLQDAAGAIGEITGEIASAEILDEMFGSFCVGK